MDEPLVLLSEWLRRWADRQPDKTALRLRVADGYRSISFADLYRRCASIAAALASQGIAPGDRVALLADNGPDWVLGYLGLHFRGAVVVPLDAQYGPSELSHLLPFAELAAVVADGARIERVEPVLQGLSPAPRLIRLDGDGPGALVNAPDANFEPHTHDLEDVISVIFTSGTTGNPKGVQLTCRNINSCVRGALRLTDVGPEDNFLNVLPLHHAYASTVGVFIALSAGATVTFCRSLKGADLMATMQETGVTILPGVPQIFTLFDRGISQRVASSGWFVRTAFRAMVHLARRLRQLTGLPVGRVLFRSIHKQFGPKFRFMMSGGAKLDPAVAERFLDLGLPILEGYGLTETAPIISFTPPGRSRPGSVGLPLEGVEVRIEAPGATGAGEICVRGPIVMKGYFRNEEATAALIRDGWLHTGDLGFIDNEGMIHITGRAKEVIVLPSGKNIYPDEVETQYEQVAGIKDICVLPAIGPDGLVQGLRAVVAPHAARLGGEGRAAARANIRRRLAERARALPSYLRITDLVVLGEDLPRTRLGKLRRNRIAQMAAQAAADEADEPAPAADASQPGDRLAEAPRTQALLTRLAAVLGAATRPRPEQDLAIDLGMDSLTQVQLFSVLEEEFGVEVPDDEADQLRTVADVIARVIRGDQPKSKKRRRRTWGDRLSSPLKVPFEEKVSLDSGPPGRFILEVARTIVMLISRMIFGASMEQKQKLPASGPMLLCPNHLSMLDGPLVHGTLPRPLLERTLFLVFGAYVARPPFSWTVGIGRIVMTGSVAQATEALKVCFEALRRDMAVVIFPEGGRSPTGDVEEPHNGAGILACEAQAPIVPILVYGSEKTMSPKQPGLRSQKVRLIVGDPIHPPKRRDFTSDDYRTMVRTWQRALHTMREELSAERLGERPE